MTPSIFLKGTWLEIAIVAAWFAVTLTTAASAQQSQLGNHQRSFYDRNGSFSGSSIDHGNTTTLQDRNGRFDGTVIRNSNGTTSYYDKNGHFTGSSTNTTPPR